MHHLSSPRDTLTLVDAHHPLVGTWALTATEWKRSDGKHANPFGEGAVGVLTYDAGGYMAAQIMRRDRPSVPQATPATIDSAFASAAAGFLSYFGTYETDDADSVVVHTVIASSFPPWVGGTHRRRYAVEGDRLTLRDDLLTSDGVPVAAATIWQRVA